MVFAEFIKLWNDDNPRMLVHTSGSTGKPKPMWVEKRRMANSAQATCAFLNLKSGDTALLCMSLNYIGGKMMAVRAIVGGLRLIEVPAKSHPLRTVNEEITLAAMVPMQVYNSMQVPEEHEKLRRIKHLLIGGSAIDEQLEAQLKTFPNAVWSTYGMTETLSHIALRRINEPMSGADDVSEVGRWYTLLPGISVSLNSRGCLVIDAPHLSSAPIETNDIAELKSTTDNAASSCLPNIPSSSTSNFSPSATSNLSPSAPSHKTGGVLFRILGRLDNVIISGGIKIQIEEAERLLRPHISAPFIISRRKDEQFGEVAALLFVAKGADENIAASTPTANTAEPNANAPTPTAPLSEQIENLRSICRRHLPKYWCPRLYIPVRSIPQTETGKPDRKAAEIIVTKAHAGA